MMEMYFQASEIRLYDTLLLIYSSVAWLRFVWSKMQTHYSNSSCI